MSILDPNKHFWPLETVSTDPLENLPSPSVLKMNTRNGPPQGFQGPLGLADPQGPKEGLWTGRLQLQADRPASAAGTTVLSRQTMVDRRGLSERRRPSSAPAMDLTDETIQTFGVAKVFADNTKSITSLDFHMSGEFLVSTSADNSIRVYDVIEAEEKDLIWSKVHGCNHARFLNCDTPSILHASTHGDESIRWLSLHSMQYQMYFTGHTDKVTALTISPQDDTFLSASEDDTIRLWDLRTPVAAGIMNLKQSNQQNLLSLLQQQQMPNNMNTLTNNSESLPLSVAYHPTGLVFAVSRGTSVHLYDTRNFTAEPFTKFQIPLETNSSFIQPTIQGADNNIINNTNNISSSNVISHVEFDSKDKNLLVTTKSKGSFLLDAYTGKITIDFSQYIENDSNYDMQGCFTPDGSHCLLGNENGDIVTFDIATRAKEEEQLLTLLTNALGGNVMAAQSALEQVGSQQITLRKNILSGHHLPPRIIKFNPKYTMFASCEQSLALWLPK